ncbi:Thiol-disulfide oxidoreductase D [Rickettsiales bacterium Ac37b]|nr:Thiol-disulfide oxidoreductase D [Rickettsiales bacterium Ac37b]
MLKIVIYLIILVGTVFPATAEVINKDEEHIDETVLNIGPNELFLGNKDAPITVIEYSSLSCPHCAYFHQNVFNQFKTKYLDSGKVKYVQRPCPFDNVALKGAMLASCTGDDYYTYLKILFDVQSSWITQKNFVEILENIAKLGGMSGEDFWKCIKSKEVEDKILKIRLDATNKLHINATPIFFINNKKFMGAMNLEKLSNILDNEYKKSN